MEILDFQKAKEDKVEEQKEGWVDELESCVTCRFFRPAGDDPSKQEAGACRYNPPVLFMMQQPAHPSGLQISGRQVMTPAQMGFMSQFPPVMPGAGCGRHEARGAKK